MEHTELPFHLRTITNDLRNSVQPDYAEKEVCASTLPEPSWIPPPVTASNFGFSMSGYDSEPKQMSATREIHGFELGPSGDEISNSSSRRPQNTETRRRSSASISPLTPNESTRSSSSKNPFRLAFVLPTISPTSSKPLRKPHYLSGGRRFSQEAPDQVAAPVATRRRNTDQSGSMISRASPPRDEKARRLDMVRCEKIESIRDEMEQIKQQSNRAIEDIEIHHETTIADLLKETDQQRRADADTRARLEMSLQRQTQLLDHTRNCLDSQRQLYEDRQTQLEITKSSLEAELAAERRKAEKTRADFEVELVGLRTQLAAQTCLIYEVKSLKRDIQTSRNCNQQAAAVQSLPRYWQCRSRNDGGCGKTYPSPAPGERFCRLCNYGPYAGEVDFYKDEGLV